MYKSSKPKLKYWSPTKLEDFYRCPRGRFLEKLLHKPLITPALAKGIHIHSAFDSLRLHHLRERKRWSSPETFANVIANDWIRGPVKTGQIRGKTILWEFEGQQYVIKESIRERCRKAYSILIEEAQPLLFLKKSATIETPEHKKYTTARRFEFAYRGRLFSGEIDEIRPNKTVRDYKTGIWRFIENKTDFAIQPTYYTLAFCYICNKNEDFRNAVGVSKEETEYWGGNPEHISPNVKFEYFMFDEKTEWNKEKKEYVATDISPIIKTTRTNFQYKELCQKIDLADFMVATMEEQSLYPAFRDTCLNCPLYKEECNRMTEELDEQRRQLTIQDYVNVSPIIYSPNRTKLKQLEFDFMKSLKRDYKPQSKSTNK